MCGAPFPWLRQPPCAADPLAVLEGLLRRAPLVIRQLGWRHGDRPALRIEDDRDLEDVIRALLSLQFDDVRLESRTPSYSPGTRTDLVLARAKIAITVKYARLNMSEPKLVEQLKEDIAYYRQNASCRVLVGFIYDPEGILRDWQTLESVRSESEEDLDVRWVVGARNIEGNDP
jgi:hypothetical protein